MGYRSVSRASPTVYLAGPISGQSYGGAVDWREQAIVRLGAAGIMAFSPMRAKEYLSKEQQLSGDPEAYVGRGFSCPKGIVTRDRFDCTTVDCVLFNLLPAEDTGIVSIGSMIEVGWADGAHIPIVMAMSKDNPHYHAMVTEIAGYLVPTFHEALSMVEAILLPNPGVDLSDLHLVPGSQKVGR